MRFAVMDITADTFVLAVGVIEIPRDITAGIILKKFGIRPLHPAFSQQRFSGFPCTAKPFEQKNRFGKFVLRCV